jgi:uncharacterized membrane protein
LVAFADLAYYTVIFIFSILFFEHNLRRCIVTILELIKQEDVVLYALASDEVDWLLLFVAGSICELGVGFRVCFYLFELFDKIAAFATEESLEFVPPVLLLLHVLPLPVPFHFLEGVPEVLLAFVVGLVVGLRISLDEADSLIFEAPSCTARLELGIWSVDFVVLVNG